MRDDHDREFSITDLSVQIFTVPSLVSSEHLCLGMGEISHHATAVLHRHASIRINMMKSLFFPPSVFKRNLFHLLSWTESQSVSS